MFKHKQLFPNPLSWLVLLIWRFLQIKTRWCWEVGNKKLKEVLSVGRLSWTMSNLSYLFLSIILFPILCRSSHLSTHLCLGICCSTFSLNAEYLFWGDIKFQTNNIKKLWGFFICHFAAFLSFRAQTLFIRFLVLELKCGESVVVFSCCCCCCCCCCCLKDNLRQHKISVYVKVHKSIRGNRYFLNGYWFGIATAHMMEQR